jgi:hypothetical protein
MLRCRIGVGYSMNIHNRIHTSIDEAYSGSSFTHRSPVMTLEAFLADCLEHLAAMALAS